MQELTIIDVITHPLSWVFFLAGAAIGLWLARKRIHSATDVSLPPLVAYGGGVIAGGLLGGLLAFLSLLLTSGGLGGAGGTGGPPPLPLTVTQVVTPTLTVTATMTPKLTPTRARPTTTAVPPPTQTRPGQPTETKAPPTETAIPAATSTITPTATLPPLPSRFEIALAGSGETTCGYPDFTYDYTVAIEGNTMSLTQIVNGIVTTGPFAPATGAFTTSQTGLPGTEIYDGVLTWDGQTVSVKGTYTYVDDPNQACEGVWQISESGSQ